MKKITIKNNTRIACRNHGFTLVEVLIAISIFTFSILAMLATLSHGITDTNYAKDRVIATYLAQEGIEFTRNVRDDNILYPTTTANWTNFVSEVTLNCINSGSAALAGCGMDDGHSGIGDGIRFLPCATTADQNCEVYLDPTTNKYGPVNQVNEANDSGFSRVISARLDAGGDRMTITSTVYWMQQSGQQSISFSEDLFNWY